VCGRDRVRKRGSALSYRVKNLRKMNDNSIVVYIGLYIISSQTKCHESSGKLVYLFSLSSKPSFPVILLLLQTTDNCIQFTNLLLQRLCAHQQPGLDSRLAYPRPRPRLNSFKIKTCENGSRDVSRPRLKSRELQVCQQPTVKASCKVFYC